MGCFSRDSGEQIRFIFILILLLNKSIKFDLLHATTILKVTVSVLVKNETDLPINTTAIAEVN